MFYWINKLFLEKTSPFKLIVIKILFLSILFLYSESVFSMVTSLERNLAYKYCDSIEKNLFKGLDNEKILKYKYFFNSINVDEINDEIKSLNNFAKEVENICTYKLSDKQKAEIRNELEIYLTTSNR